MKTSEWYGLVRKTMLILSKLNDLDRPDDDSCHNLFPFVHIEMNFCSAYLNPALRCGPFSRHLTIGLTIPFLCVCRLLQFHKNPLFHQEPLPITLALILHVPGPTSSSESNACSPHKSAILILHSFLIEKSVTSPPEGTKTSFTSLEAAGEEWKLSQTSFTTFLFWLLILPLIQIFVARIFALRKCNVTLVRMRSFLTLFWLEVTSAWENTNNESLLTLDIYVALVPFAASLGDF